MTSHPLIAIVSMDGIFPGAANLAQFWDNIVNGVNCSAPAPPSRWIAPARDRLSQNLVPDRTYSDHACLIDHFDFEPEAFSLDPKLTRHLDPVHQLTLTAGRRAVAACQTTDVDPERIDTILAAIALPTDGASAFSRKLLGPALAGQLFGHETGTGKSLSQAEALASRADGLPAALLAAEMGFGGASFTLDAACASSIYAVKLACDALGAGRSDMVVTGGVSRPECLYTQTGFSQLSALSRSGRCAPFDHRADGLVVGEGVGIVVLKRLEDAMAQGDTIHGVIHGIGLSNDMRGNLLAPENRGQLRAMGAAYKMAGWQPSDVELIECHGTGTRAGDTTEIESLIQLWQDQTAAPGSCSIGSVKSMIGHLLTAAGAAGMIKVLLAMANETLPPSVNFERPPSDSSLEDSPFRVQTQPQAWTPKREDQSRRAAVSAFGFGGINAHILIEQGQPSDTQPAAKATASISLRSSASEDRHEPVAIIGMDLAVGTLNDRSAFEQAIFEGSSALAPRPADRWKGVDDTLINALGGCDPHGAYIDQVALGIGQFQIPPNEINDILPQQLLALKTGAGALADAGLALREARETMGVVMGIGFDFEATNFHLRWQLYNAVRRWNQTQDLGLDDALLDQWLERLRDDCHPPLTPPRVVGALGGIVASRMAREFRLGGPSFVASADTASGLHGLQIAVDQLRGGQVDAMLVGAVDLAGEARNIIRLSGQLPLSPSNVIRPFDPQADGTLPGDGAVALVLKRLDRARADKDRIYAVIRGMGAASGGDPSTTGLTASAYRRSLSRALAHGDVAPDTVSYVEAHAPGVVDRDRMELSALAGFFGVHGQSDPSRAIALGSAKPTCGYTGTADGLVSVAKAALCLHHRRLPPLGGCTNLMDLSDGRPPFHIPRRSQPWYRDREGGPRNAVCAAITMDATCSHVLLQEAPAETGAYGATRSVPPRTGRSGLFAISGNTPGQLEQALNRLQENLQAHLGALDVEAAALRWLTQHPIPADHRLALTLIFKPDQSPLPLLEEARQAIADGAANPRSRQIFYTSQPLGPDAKIAWLYPGSGNHYLGMGCDLALAFPQVVARMDLSTARLKTQFRPWHLMPWRRSWQPGWEADAESRLTADPLNMIFGQVVFGSLMGGVLQDFSIPTDALIGYSLGESAALFAHGVWPDRGEMLSRMQATDLFTTQLAGPCNALQRAWGLTDGQSVRWRVAVVNRPAETVRKALKQIAQARLLIVNTPDECVIGGLEAAVGEAIEALGCQAFFLDGVVTVHCDAAAPVADAYRQLHHFPTTAKQGLSVYSCSRSQAYDISADSIADSIRKQAVDGFDFIRTINQAYADGHRIFLEVGPRATCSRMVDRILADRPHLAVAANHGRENEIDALRRCLAKLISHRVPVDLTLLYQGVDASQPAETDSRPRVDVVVGGQALDPTPPPKAVPATASPTPSAAQVPQPASSEIAPKTPAAATDGPEALQQLIQVARQNMETTATAHQQFLELSQEMTAAYAKTFELQNRLLAMGAQPDETMASNPPETFQPPVSTPVAPLVPARSGPPPVYDRDMCMQFAIGSVGAMLGTDFDIVDTYPVRVRLPDEPLMLVDRIMEVTGEPLSMGAGKVVTEHDVHPGAWYLDGGRAPVCISVEAGQADLFLCSYLGIDHQVKGTRAYRLLDAVVTFHRGLPQPGDIIRYEIAIDRFVHSGETWMFFFRFEGYIGDQHLITMRDGCAGFFTKEEVANSGGIILTQEEKAPVPGKRPADWQALVPMAKESYTDVQIDALRRGDLAACFGEAFAGKALADSLTLPDGRMRLVHRVLELDPAGGRYGLGAIRAEADIRPDDWFLTCHFVDDMVMPGTLMYECCAHTLRVFLQRMGWVTDKPGVCYEPVIGNGARLKCRGPVTPETRHVHYEIQISEIGYGPEPYVIADAHMFADGEPIVFFKDMSLKMTGVTRQEIEAIWTNDQPAVAPMESVLYDQASILAFATGNPSEAFGEPYRDFDQDRKIARLPGPPYCFMDRVVATEPEPWQLAPGGWITAQYDIPADEWYFAADRSGVMPFCVLLEIALQPCGWLAAYAGSALRSERDLKFRNLGGNAVLHRQVTPDSGTLTMRSRMTKVSEAADMIIENFDFEVLDAHGPVYTGDTYFGFFSAAALADQKGLGEADPMVQAMASFAHRNEGSCTLAIEAPVTPDAARGLPADTGRLEQPAKALLMLDTIETHIPDAFNGLDYIRGSKQVDPDEWFFAAHFYQDPVCPGSLGLESFIQLLKQVALTRWPHLAASHRFRLAENSRHSWSYRGQYIPTNKKVVVEARVTAISEDPVPLIRADGLLAVDGLPIYKMENFELALVPAT